MTVEWIHPGLVLIVGAWLIPFLKGTLKRGAMIAVPALALGLCVSMEPGTYGTVRMFGQELVFGRADRLSLVFSYVFSLLTLIGMVYALHVDNDAQHVTALTYGGAALGATFAGDLLSLYLFWELMAVAAVLLVWLNRTPEAVAAGVRYLLVHGFGGLRPLAGVVLIGGQSGSFAFTNFLPYQGTTGFWLI